MIQKILIGSVMLTLIMFGCEENKQVHDKYYTVTISGKRGRRTVSFPDFSYDLPVIEKQEFGNDIEARDSYILEQCLNWAEIKCTDYGIEAPELYICISKNANECKRIFIEKYKKE